MLPVTVLCLLAVQSLAHAAKSDASDYFPICHRTDTDLAGCVRKSIEALFPKLVKGIPELHIAPLDPLYIERLEMKEGNGNFKFYQILSNLTIHGLGDSDVKEVTIDLKKDLMTVKLFAKHVDFDGDYDMAGRMMVIDIKGTGKAVMNFTDVTTKAFIQGETYKKKGVEFFRVKSLKWKIEPEGAKFYFSNLFNGDKTLGEATNRFLNENWREAFEVYMNLPEEAFGTLMKDMANKVYSAFSYNTLLPE